MMLLLVNRRAVKLTDGTDYRGEDKWDWSLGSNSLVGGLSFQTDGKETLEATIVVGWDPVTDLQRLPDIGFRVAYQTADSGPDIDHYGGPTSFVAQGLACDDILGLDEALQKLAQRTRGKRSR
jgi:hypothetical protein